MSLIKKGNKLYSILNLKCPRCHEGNLFHTGTWSFQDITGMPDTCPNCGQNYMPEPGFYYGAMFISYIFWGFFCVILGSVCIIGLGWSVNQTTLLLIGISAVFLCGYSELPELSGSMPLYILTLQLVKKN